MAGIYLMKGKDELIEMTEQPYDSERLLQEFLAKYPSLLAGDQINSSELRRWLLVSREMRLAYEEGGAERWSVDHLFLDQDGIPTLVEVKRSSDTRIRREVVGQMLDYAANAVVYWPIDTIRARFINSCEDQNPDEVIEAFLGLNVVDEGNAVEHFWQKVQTNLQAGKVRLIFVADAIPPELQRIVEFLNAQMNPAEVLAVEIKQYMAPDDLRTLVPRVIGQTAEAQQKKSPSRHADSQQWDETSWFENLATRQNEEAVKVVQRFQRWAIDKPLQSVWSSQRKDDRATFWIQYEGKVAIRLFGFRVDGKIEIRL
jgi:hypothetical protein